MKIIRLKLAPDMPVTIPFAHMEMLQGVVYRLLRSANPELGTEVHDKMPEESSGKAFKYFCFTDLIGPYRIQNRSLIYEKPFEWEIRSADERIAEALETAAKQSECLLFMQQPCTVVSATASNMTCPDGEHLIRMNTPILVYSTEENGYVHYRNPGEQDFYDGIIGNYRSKWKSFHETEDCPAFSICGEKITDRDKCVTRFKGTILTGWYGIYRVSGSSQALDFLYHTGLGGKNAMGFGSFFFL